MGLDIYKLKVQPLPKNLTLEEAKNFYDGDQCYSVMRLDNIEDFEKPLIEFVKKTGQYTILKEKVCELNKELEAYLKHRNITIQDTKNWSYMEMTRQYVQDEINYYQEYDNKNEQDYACLADLAKTLPLIDPNKHYIKISYESNEDFDDALNFLQYCQNQHVLGQIIIQDCQQSGTFNFQNKFLVVEYLLEPQEVENIVWKYEEVGYQRKGFKQDLSFFKKYYGSCWYMIENEETEAIQEPMIFLIDNKLLQQVKKTFKDDTPIQNWVLKEDEYIYFSA